MALDVIKELEAAKAKVAELESSLAKEIKDKLAGLPADYGFDSLPAFIKALKQAAGKSGGKRGRPAKAVKVAKAVKSGGKRKGKRARITSEMKEEVKAAVAAGKTGAAIAKEFGISLPSVQNIKKEFGLVKKRR